MLNVRLEDYNKSQNGVGYVAVAMLDYYGVLGIIDSRAILGTFAADRPEFRVSKGALAW